MNHLERALKYLHRASMSRVKAKRMQLAVRGQTLRMGIVWLQMLCRMIKHAEQGEIHLE